MYMRKKLCPTCSKFYYGKDLHSKLHDLGYYRVGWWMGWNK
jgi:hypothetical protein